VDHLGDYRTARLLLVNCNMLVMQHLTFLEPCTSGFRIQSSVLAAASNLMSFDRWKLSYHSETFLSRVLHRSMRCHRSEVHQRLGL
jgi:hypothetical protein